MFIVQVDPLICRSPLLSGYLQSKVDITLAAIMRKNRRELKNATGKNGHNEPLQPIRICRIEEFMEFCLDVGQGPDPAGNALPPAGTDEP